MAATKGKGAFGVPADDLDIWIDAPDGVMRQYNDMTRSALSDSRWVSNNGSQAFGWGAFPDDSDPAMEAPSMFGDADSTGTATATSSKTRLGRQR